MPNAAKNSRISSMVANKYSVLSSFKHGYRNREDKTNLAPNIMVTPSQNVLTNVSGRIGSRKGYTLDGQASSVLAPILAAFDWPRHTGDTKHLRAGFLTSAGSDGKLQYRYVASDGTVTWRDLLTSQTSVNFNFTNYWDNTQKVSLLLFVNGGSNITEWTGGVTTVASVGANTITKSGTSTWAAEGFYTTGTHKVTIGGVDYTATGGWATLTLTGVTPDPAVAAPPIVVGDIAHQTPETTANSAMTGIPSTFANSLIANLRNQIYIGSFTSQLVYVSKVDNYKDYSFTAPVRLVGEGIIFTLRGTPKAFIQQQDAMYISAGEDQWYQTKFVLSADLTAESAEASQLKTASLQGTQSQGLTANLGNSVVFLSNEPVISSLGPVSSVLLVPQITDMSFPIVNDINALDFEDGDIQVLKNFVYITAPGSSTMLIYNMTDPNSIYWEAPQILPISYMSVIDGVLYGHSYQTSETYKLFDGYTDNGNFIDSQAWFAFNSFNMRGTRKKFNEYYVEGYISAPTTLNLNLNYDLDGNQTSTSFPIVGIDTQIVAIPTSTAPLGKESLGKQSLGGDNTAMSTLPPKFRVVKTFNMVPFYEYQVGFTSLGLSQNWEVLAFGPSESPAAEQNNAIRQ